MELTLPRTPSSPPRITPVPAGERPLWSVMIPAYNCLSYLADAISSVLAQDQGAAQMQIEVVDDASTDGDVAALVARLGQGRVGYYRQPQNVGSLRNFETCLNRTTGHYVHLLHGDDRVVPGFYDAMTQLLAQHPEAGAAFSNYASIDETGRQVFFPPSLPEYGILHDWLVRIAESQYMQYACVVVRRAVYEHLGGFYGTNYGEDWEMWVRIARYYPVAYTPEVLAEYRGHSASISSEKEKHGLVLADSARVMALIQEHLPEKDRKWVSALSRKHCATMGIGTAYRVLQETNNWSLLQNQVNQVLAMSKHPLICYYLVKLYLKCLIFACRKGR